MLLFEFRIYLQVIAPFSLNEITYSDIIINLLKAKKLILLVWFEGLTCIGNLIYQQFLSLGVDEVVFSFPIVL